MSLNLVSAHMVLHPTASPRQILSCLLPYPSVLACLVSHFLYWSHCHLLPWWGPGRRWGIGVRHRCSVVPRDRGRASWLLPLPDNSAVSRWRGSNLPPIQVPRTSRCAGCSTFGGCLCTAGWQCEHVGRGDTWLTSPDDVLARTW